MNKFETPQRNPKIGRSDNWAAGKDSTSKSQDATQLVEDVGRFTFSQESTNNHQVAKTKQFESFSSLAKIESFSSLAGIVSFSSLAEISS
jgi:hypothetical protein